MLPLTEHIYLCRKQTTNYCAKKIVFPRELETGLSEVDLKGPMPKIMGMKMYHNRKCNHYKFTGHAGMSGILDNTL